MCGFAGFIGNCGAASTYEETARSMAASIRHRGPDDAGVWCDPAAGMALGHCRLSVVDLSPAGHQPMLSAGGRYVLALNGEIYNHRELRSELERGARAPAWRGHSDTEVLLAAIDAFGLKEALQRSVGMFALALWDRETRTLSLARDRLGEKPLYYGAPNGAFLFGSEIAALRQHPAWRGQIDRDALVLMLRYNNVPAPYSIYQDVFKLEPGTILEVTDGGHTLKSACYWSAREAVEAGAKAAFAGTFEEAADTCERLIRASLKGQMLADVPLGAFLSGGIDSSAIVALMQDMSERPVKTFTIGFDDPEYDEAPEARAVAAHLKTDHTEFHLTAAGALATIPELPRVYSEPFADSSQIPALLVSRMARQHVTVALSGDGGDEVFSGYNRYTVAETLWPRVSGVPRMIRQATARTMTALPPASWDKLARAVPSRMRPRTPGDKIHKFANVLGSASIHDVYRAFLAHWPDADRIVMGTSSKAQRADEPASDGLPAVRRMMTADACRYLPDDILVKVDRAAMSVALETRVPFLDHRLFEFAATLPLNILRRGGQAKWPLRRILDRYVPRDILERPKSGFAVPIDRWLRGPLRDWAEALLDETRLRREGFFRPEPIRRAWAQHLAGTRNLQHPLWVVLMFQQWHEHWEGGRR